MKPIRFAVAGLLAAMFIFSGCETDDGADQALGTFALDPSSEEYPESDGKGGDGNVLNVPADYASIQQAIDAAGNGDSVQVASGLYDENLVMKWGVSVAGDSQAMPVLYGTVKFENIEDSQLTHFVLDGILDGSSGTGVYMANSAARVEAVTVRNFTTGIAVVGPLGMSEVTRCEVSNCSAIGILVDGIAGAAVTNSIVTGCESGIAVEQTAGAVSDVAIVNCNVLACGFGGSGAALALAVDTGCSAFNNIVVGNALGYFCGPFSCNADFNIVWGNSVNYELLSLPGINDITKDPRFANWAEGDYHLMFDSPAIDAGTLELFASTDKDGYDRPQGHGVDIGAYEYVVSNKAITLAINEIMANPVDESTGEFVELYNYGTDPMEAAGLTIDDGDSKDVLVGFQDGASQVPAGGYAVILDPGYAGQYDIPAGTILLTVASTATIGSGLSNSDPVMLRDPTGNLLVDSYSYPFNAGNGVSVEKDSAEDGDIKTNWKASPCGFTPGAQNCASLPPNVSKDVYIAINEVMANPLDEGTGEYIELFNFADEAIDVGNFRLSDGDATSTIAGWQGGTTLLLPGEYGLILDPDYAGEYDIPSETVLLAPSSGTKIGNGVATNDPITLFDETGLTVIDSCTHNFNPGNGKAIEKVDFTIGDIQSNWVTSPCGATPGKANCAYEQGLDPVTGVTLAITEVMANPLDEDTGEFVELYNYGDKAVDVSGFRLSDGDAEDNVWGFGGGPAIVPPGAYAVILDAEYAGEYDIPAGAVLLTTDNTTIGNGLSTNDTVVLRSESAAVIVDSFMFPFNPGNGISAEKIALVVGDVPQNWTASTCMSSPGQTNCVAGGEVSNVATSTLVVTEVMANPLNEGTGEFVELYNAGSAPADAAGMYFSDGTNLEALQAFAGGSTVIQPGAFAVILDAGYDAAYTIPVDAVLLTTGDATLGNGLSTSDLVTLFEKDGATQVSSFSFPYNPGNGKSIEKMTMNGADVSPNWKTSTCKISLGDSNDGASPGDRNCVDPYGDITGTSALGQPCPNGAADCFSGLCAVELLSGLSYCTADCSADECPLDFQCVLTGDVNYPWICEPTAATCENLCTTGEKVCVDGQTYALCADHNGDGCTEFGGETACVAWGVCDGGDCVLGPAPGVLLNEVLYDATGADTNTYVELWAPPGLMLDGLTLVGINGSNGAVYNAIGLTGVVPADGYFVISHPESTGAVAAAADMLDKDVDYQNGPDSIELRWGTDVVDALGYGAFDQTETFAGEGLPAEDVGAGHSLGRDALHTDTDDNAADFYECVNPTPGTDNDC